jgi:two-component system, cell cycle sensor histidine kinase and response regulator CckA
VFAIIVQRNEMEARELSKEELVSELQLRVSEIESLKTRLQQAEADLRAGQEMQRTLLENPIVAVGLSEGNQVLYANRLLLELFGYSDLDEFLSIPLIDHVAQSSRAAILDRLEKTVAGIPYDPTFVHDIRRKDGSVRTLDINVLPYRWKGRSCRFTLFRDVTESKRAEAAFRESEAKYRALVETTDTGYVILDPEGRVLDANPEYVRLTGHGTLLEILGRKVVEWTARNDLARNAQEIRKCLEQGSVRDLELDYINTEGKLTPIEINATALHTAEGIRIVTLCRDITELKRLEAQFLQSQKMEAIGVLAGGVAHDFNNLLSVINGYSELLQTDLGPDYSRIKDLEQIRQAGRYAASLTSQLLAFSRRQILQPQTIDLNDVVSDTCKILRRVIGETIELTVYAQPDLGFVKADPGQIEQVIMNLAVNARDAMPKRGRLTIETANVLLDEAQIREFPGMSAGPHVMLVVRDTGTGIDRETQAHIFEPFFTTKEFGRGTGLGLSTVYGIVKQSNGYIGIDSMVGKGTSFRIYFPQAQSRADRSGGAAMDGIDLSGTETVLLVEDDAAVRVLAVRVLNDRGYRVLEAANGKEALRKVHEFAEAIHLIVTDVVMPEMSGLELVAQVRLERPSVKVLLVSGYAGEDIAQHGMLDPTIALLPKPFTPTSLAHKVRGVIDSGAA